MSFQFLFVMAPLCTLVLCRALTLPDHRKPEVLDHYNATLNARVVLPDPTQAANPKTTNLFSVGTAATPGNCLSDTSTIDGWLEESVDLHNAATSVFAYWQSSSACRYLLAAWLGVQFTQSNGVWSVAISSLANFNTIESRMSAVSVFLNGGGVSSPVTNAPPWIFCGGGFANYQPWGQPAMDHAGQYIPNGYASDGVTVTSYLTVQEAFPSLFAQYTPSAPWLPYWITALNGYYFDKKEICSSQTTQRYASTTTRGYTPQNQYVAVSSWDRNVFFCPRAFSPTTVANPSTAHSIAGLATAVSTDMYPTSPFPQTALDQYIPLSGTMYHELYHITDSAQTSNDAVGAVGLASRSAITGSPVDKATLTGNAESYLYFAMAAYMYLNAPDSTPTVLFLQGGLPMLTSDAVAKWG